MRRIHIIYEPHASGVHINLFTTRPIQKKKSRSTKHRSYIINDAEILIKFIDKFLYNKNLSLIIIVIVIHEKIVLDNFFFTYI